MAEALEGLIERLDGHVRYKYMPAAVRTSLEEAAQALRLLGEVEKALEPFANFWDSAKHLGGTFPKTGAFYAVESSVGGEREITVEDFKGAQAALDKLRKGMGEPKQRLIFSYYDWPKPNDPTAAKPEAIGRLLSEAQAALEQIAESDTMGFLDGGREAEGPIHSLCLKIARSALDKLRKGINPESK